MIETENWTSWFFCKSWHYRPEVLWRSLFSGGSVVPVIAWGLLPQYRSCARLKGPGFTKDKAWKNQRWEGKTKDKVPKIATAGSWFQRSPKHAVRESKIPKEGAALDTVPKAHRHTFARVGNVVFTSPFLQHVRTKFWFHRVSKARKEEFPEVCKAGSCRFLFHRSAFPRHRIMNFQRKSQRTYLTLCDKIRFWHMCFHILRQTLTYCWHVLLYDIAWHILEQFLYVLHGYFEISSDIFSDALSLSVSCSLFGGFLK